MQPKQLMAQEIFYDNELDCMVVRTTGFGSLESIHKSHRELMSHPKWKPGRNVVVDHRKLELSHLKPSDIACLVNMVKNSRTELGDGRFAVVIASDFTFGLGRMWEISTEPDTDLSICIFRDPEEAFLWVSQPKR